MSERSERAVALLLDRPPAVAGSPPGVDPTAFAHALAESSQLRAATVELTHRARAAARPA